VSDRGKRAKRRAAERAARQKRKQPPIIELPPARIKIKNEEKK